MGMHKKMLESVMAVVLLFMIIIVMSHPKRWLVAAHKESDREQTVLIDAGHGGNDPGKIGVNDALEKDINLSIACKLKVFLEDAGITVVMTRDTDTGLYSQQAKNKKAEDLKNRCALIEEKNPDLVVSIHQNSYHEEYVSGAQAFYYTHSVEGKKAAEIIQETLRVELGSDNKRVAKANDSYYLLRKTKAPTVIVECGFLSNYEEAAKLVDVQYQEKIARAIQLAVSEFLSGK